jgi:hypothetical protein
MKHFETSLRQLSVFRVLESASPKLTLMLTKNVFWLCSVSIFFYFPFKFDKYLEP